MPKSKNLLSLLPLLVLILIFILGFLAVYKLKEEQNSLAEFNRAQSIKLPELSFTNLYDKNDKLTNEDLVKNNYSLLNIFASWCTTCLAEHDELIKLSKSGLVDIYAVAFQDIDENTKKYLEKYQNPYIKIGVDKKGELLKLLFVKAVPETFLINKKGEIIHRHQGALNKKIIEFYKKILLD
jgi:cytochrome c biogenesis protein CcmG, thiol:disulfide interchange protein DsbE